MRLTAAGRIFEKNAQKLIADYEQAVEELELYKNGVSSIIRIGFLMGSYGAFLPLVCERFRKMNPDVEFRFRTLELPEMQPALNKNEIDVGMMIFTKGFEGSQFAHRVLFSDSYKLAVPKGHPLAKRKSIRLEDLKGEYVLSPRFNQSKSMQAQMSIKLKKKGIDVTVVDDISDVGALMAMCVSEKAVALALDHLDVFGGGNIVFLSIEDLETEILVGPVWKKSKETETLLAFLDFLQKETSGFDKEDYLSRKGSEGLEWR